MVTLWLVKIIPLCFSEIDYPGVSGIDYSEGYEFIVRTGIWVCPLVINPMIGSEADYLVIE